MKSKDVFLEIDSSNEKSLFDALDRVVYNLYRKYKYVAKNRTLFDEFAYGELRKLVSSYDGKYDGDVYNYFKSGLASLIKEKVRIEILENNSFEIMNRYIENHFDFRHDSLMNFSELKKLESFFSEFEINPSLEIYSGLIQNNQSINECLKNYIALYYDEIKNKGIDELVSNPLLIAMVDVYCISNNLSLYDYDFDRVAKELKNQDSLEAYMKEINKPLLTQEEERYLLKQVALGNEKAKNELIERNLKLVVSVVRPYIGHEMPTLDLIQEGNIGLIHAAERYSLDKGTKFSTYAVYWIRQSVIRARYDKEKVIRIPVHMYSKALKYKRMYSELSEILNKEPTINELATYCDISINELSYISTLPLDIVSLNQQINMDDDSELMELVASDALTPEEIVMDKDRKEGIISLLKKVGLSEREIEILKYRYGIGNTELKTLAEVSEIFGLSRERIRQIEIKSLSKIRNSKHLELFAKYTDEDEFYMSKVKKSEIGCFLADYDVCEDRKENNQIKTIYQLLKPCGKSKDEIDEMLKGLSKRDLELIKLRYGDDLLHPVSSNNFGIAEQQKFYGNLLRKMKRLLK